MKTSPGQRLRQWRDFKGLTLADVSRATGIKTTTLSTTEQPGASNPSYDTISKVLATYPDLNPDWLLLGTGPMLRDGRALTPAQQLPQPKAPGVPSYAEEAEPLSISRLTPAEVAAMQAELVATKRALETANQTIERLWDQNTVLIKKPEASADAADLRSTVDQIAAEHQARMQLIERPDIARFDIRPRPQMRVVVSGLRQQAS